jgi:hypothetical protein
MISWVHYVYLSLGFSSTRWLTLWDPRIEYLFLVLHVGWRLWNGEHEFWWSRSFTWSDWDTDGSPYPCSWTLIPRIVVWHLHLLCEHSHTLLMLTWNVKLLLCLLNLVACIIIALSCILFLMRHDLFTACGVHRSDYACFLRGLICSPLVECTDQIILASCAAWFIRRFVS